MGRALSVVGQRVPAYAGAKKVTGAAKFSVDISLPGMLVGKLLHSPFAHANIKKIDTSAADALPGVAAVITWRDVPQIPLNPSVQDWTVPDVSDEVNDLYVVSEKARFVGDIIAAVAAVDQATADRALELIAVDYQVLPAVFDPVEAMKPGAPIVHDSAPTNVSRSFRFPGSRGDVEGALKEADVVVEATFKTSKQYTTPLEPLSCLANFGPAGELTVWMPVQRPLTFRKKIAELFELPESKVNVICEYAGGFFGEANWPVLPICVALAKASAKPVKLEFTRPETAFNTGSREVYVLTGTLGATADGVLTALKEEVLVDSGAYFNRSAACTTAHMSDFVSLYRCPSVSAEATAVYSNIPIASGVRGYGGPPAYFLLEQLMDMAAAELGTDPVEFRLRNVKHLGDFGRAFPVETATQEQVIKLGAEKIGWTQKRARVKAEGSLRRGVGMAAYSDVNGGQPFERFDRHIEMQLNEDGSVTIIFNHPDGGMNLLGTVAQIAAEILGIAYDEVRFVHASTVGKLWDAGMGANSGLYTIGNAVVLAAQALKEKILAEAATQLGIDCGELELDGGAVRVKAAEGALTAGEPGAAQALALTLKELANNAAYQGTGANRSLAVVTSYHPTTNPNPWGAVFADVAVDVETGEISVEKLVLVHDIGRAINPTTVEGQLQGGISMGVGYALYEDASIDPATGVMRGDNFNTYKIPSTLDMPELEVVLWEEPTPSGPFGGKGVGMCGVHGIAPAIANAIFDALGVRVSELPLTPERVLAAIKST
jgi:xanthine dehydrogenase molybdenum-binding subunit